MNMSRCQHPATEILVDAGNFQIDLCADCGHFIFVRSTANGGVARLRELAALQLCEMVLGAASLTDAEYRERLTEIERQALDNL